MEITLPTLIDLFSATKQTEGNSNRTIEWYRVSKAKIFTHPWANNSPTSACETY